MEILLLPETSPDSGGAQIAVVQTREITVMQSLHAQVAALLISKCEKSLQSHSEYRAADTAKATICNMP